MEESEELGITKSLFSRHWQRFQDMETSVDVNILIIPRVTTLNEDQCLAVTPKRCRTSKASDLSRQLSAASDESRSRLSLKSDSRRTSLWRTPNTRHLQDNIIELHRYGSSSGLQTPHRRHRVMGSNPGAPEDCAHRGAEVRAQNSPVGLAWKFGGWCRQSTKRLKITRPTANYLRFPFEYDVNKNQIQILC
ncbi:hypothetical protein TNCV_3538151 [Trichonephila clavipes]|nr:hypothetical protein TNCV_3538151 [Trichonephila clavipes]